VIKKPDKSAGSGFGACSDPAGVCARGGAHQFIIPDWPAPENIRAAVTTRKGGYSQSPFNSFNLGDHVDDDPETVKKNRRLLNEILSLPNEPAWLEQIHTTNVVNAEKVEGSARADASYTAQKNAVCVVMTADCLPVFFCSEDGSEVAVAHAGWRGLAAGILEATVEKMNSPAQAIMAWMGPAIGPDNFEVGEEVRDAFMQQNSETENAFQKNKKGKWLADIYSLARVRLKQSGVQNISGGGFCTYQNAEQFFSYRRDGKTGRMGSLIWIK